VEGEVKADRESQEFGREQRSRMKQWRYCSLDQLELGDEDATNVGVTRVQPRSPHHLETCCLSPPDRQQAHLRHLGPASSHASHRRSLSDQLKVEAVARVKAKACPGKA